jgi:hypothetical protein
MTSLTRREALGALSAAPAVVRAYENAEIPAAVIRRHEEGIDRLLASQVLDKSSRGYGTLEDPRGVYAVGSAAGLINACMAAYLHPRSRFHSNALLIERMKLAAGYMERNQHPDGFIDYRDTNFDSPPDTAFTIHSLATAACLAKRAKRTDLLAITEPYMRKAGAGLVIGGIHTPNHRWVVSSALAQINEVFPDPAYLRRIDQWLAEGIDIDEDGQFTERSTSVYNAICDRSFLVMAVKLRRPDLLEPVRKNLDSMLYLLHSDYTVVTEISRRQDRDQRTATMASFWFPLQYLAVKDGNGQFASLANHLAPQSASLPAYMEYPEMAGRAPAPAPLPDRFERGMKSLGIVRVRRGPVSATLFSNNPAFFALHNGDVAIEGIRFASAFFGKGQFLTLSIEKNGTDYILRQKLEAGYYQPLNPPQRVTPANWSALRKERAETQKCTLDQVATITPTAKGFRVRIQASGAKDVPVSIEINLRNGGKLDGATRAADGEALLPAGFATCSGPENRIRFGPGLGEHRYTQVRGALPKLPGASVYLTAFTPCDHTLEFDCG